MMSTKRKTKRITWSDSPIGRISKNQRTNDAIGLSHPEINIHPLAKSKINKVSLFISKYDGTLIFGSGMSVAHCVAVFRKFMSDVGGMSEHEQRLWRVNSAKELITKFDSLTPLSSYLTRTMVNEPSEGFIFKQGDILVFGLGSDGHVGIIPYDTSIINGKVKLLHQDGVYNSMHKSNQVGVHISDFKTTTLLGFLRLKRL